MQMHNSVLRTTILFNSFAALCIFYLAIILLGHENIAWYLKPMLLPFHFLGVIFSEKFLSKKYLLAALAFSWVGDVALLFSDHGESYFIIGLICFLIAHIFYIILFLKQGNTITNKSRLIFWIGFCIILIYLTSLLLLLFPILGNLKIPVTIYAITITIMIIVALKGYFIWKKPANLLILLGAIVFVISDSILAINKFYIPLANASFFIMFTYLMAQFCITKGILILNKIQIGTS